MTRRARKILVWAVIAVIIIAIGAIAHKNIQYDRGVNETYSLDSQDVQKKDGILVLCYHRILNDTPGVKVAENLTRNSQLHDFNVPASQFAQQMKYLHDHNVKIISGDQMHQMVKEGKPIKGKYAVLSFDDIDRTTIENAIPIMKKYGYPFTTFVITGNTGRYREGSKLATWDQIRGAKRFAGNLMTIGLHTNNMHYLTDKLVPIFNLRQNYPAFKRDFAISRHRLHQEIGSYGREFAYPYGGGNDLTSNFLAKQHLNWVATLNSGLVDNHTNLVYTPRTIVNNKSWPSIEQWVSNNHTSSQHHYDHISSQYHHEHEKKAAIRK